MKDKTLQNNNHIFNEKFDDIIDNNLNDTTVYSIQEIFNDIIDSITPEIEKEEGLDKNPELLRIFTLNKIKTINNLGNYENFLHHLPIKEEIKVSLYHLYKKIYDPASLNLVQKTNVSIEEHNEAIKNLCMRIINYKIKSCEDTYNSNYIKKLGPIEDNISSLETIILNNQINTGWMNLLTDSKKEQEERDRQLAEELQQRLNNDTSSSDDNDTNSNDDDDDGYYSDSDDSPPAYEDIKHNSKQLTSNDLLALGLTHDEIEFILKN